MPSLVAATISSARCWTTSGEMPSGSEPANRPPDSLSTTRRQLGCCSPASPAGTGVLSVIVSAWPLSPALRLADLEPGERGDGDPRRGEDLLHRGLLLLHERLLDQR